MPRSHDFRSLRWAPLALVFAGSVVGCSSADQELPVYTPPVKEQPDGGLPPTGGTLPDAGAPDDAKGGVPLDADPKAADPAGVCAVTAKGTAGLVLKGTVLARTGVLEGEVGIDDQGVIGCVDASCASWAGYAAATKVACDGGVISPAFINSHDHIDYAITFPYDLGTRRFDHRNGWRSNASGVPGANSSGANANYHVAAAELRFVMSGATGTVSSGGIAGLLRNYTGVTAALEGLQNAGMATGQFDTFPLGDSSRTNPPLNGKACADYKPKETMRTAGTPKYFPHISEGVNWGAENELDCLTTGKTDVVKDDTAIIHAIGITAARAWSGRRAPTSRSTATRRRSRS
jgi:hypothetical protein